MPGKVPQPWYRESKGAWYVCVGGKQHCLGKDRAKAFSRFHRLMARQGEGGASVDPNLTVEQLVTLYLADVGRRIQANTLRVTRGFLDTFARKHGKLRAHMVRPFHVEAWVQDHPRWNATTEGLAKNRVVMLFNFAVQQGLLASNPVRGIRKPPQRSRGTQALITPEQHGKLLGAAEACFRNVLLALHQTGARPGEVTSVTAQELDAQRGVWVLTRHKNAGKGKARIVFLTPELVALCQELAAKYPEGPLFRTQRGTPFGWCGLSKRMAWLRQRLGLPATITPYGYRHTFATDALASGVPDAQVAELLGHQGTAMLHKHYAHLTARARALRASLDHVRGSQQSP
jgi:integrase